MKTKLFFKSLFWGATTIETGYILRCLLERQDEMLSYLIGCLMSIFVLMLCIFAICLSAKDKQNDTWWYIAGSIGGMFFLHLFTDVFGVKWLFGANFDVPWQYYLPVGCYYLWLTYLVYSSVRMIKEYFCLIRKMPQEEKKALWTRPKQIQIDDFFINDVEEEYGPATFQWHMLSFAIAIFSLIGFIVTKLV